MGTIYELALDAYDDDGTIIRRLRRTPPISLEGVMLFFEKLEILIEAGLGLNGSGSGSDPMLSVKWSNDSGKTWQDEVWLSMGKIGEYRKKLRIYSMGSTSDGRVYEIVITEPIPIRILDGFINYGKGK